METANTVAELTKLIEKIREITRGLLQPEPPLADSARTHNEAIRKLSDAILTYLAKPGEPTFPCRALDVMTPEIKQFIKGIGLKKKASFSTAFIADMMDTITAQDAELTALRAEHNRLRELADGMAKKLEHSGTHGYCPLDRYRAAYPKEVKP